MMYLFFLNELFESEDGIWLKIGDSGASSIGEALKVNSTFKKVRLLKILFLCEMINEMYET